MLYTPNSPRRGPTEADDDFVARALPLGVPNRPEIAALGESILCTAEYVGSLGEAALLCLEELPIDQRGGKAHLAVSLLNLLDDQVRILFDLAGKVEVAGIERGHQPRGVTMLRGVTEIADVLDMPNRQVAHLINQGLLPIFRADGCPCATEAALADWKALNATGKIPSK